MNQNMPKQHLGAHIGPAPTNKQLGITMMPSEPMQARNTNSEVVGKRVRSICCKSFFLMIGVMEFGGRRTCCAICGHPID